MELGFLDCIVSNADSVTKTAIFGELVGSGFVNTSDVCTQDNVMALWISHSIMFLELLL
jgi:hypothetical protein